MAGMTRRRLLQVGAGAGLTALAADPLMQAALAKKKLPPADLTDIEHVVILIQENRSFDHYFGMLPGVRGFGDKTAPKSVFEQQGYPEAGFGGVLLPFHPTRKKGRAIAATRTSPTRGSRCTKPGTTEPTTRS